LHFLSLLKKKKNGVDLPVWDLVYQRPDVYYPEEEKKEKRFLFFIKKKKNNNEDNDDKENNENQSEELPDFEYEDSDEDELNPDTIHIDLETAPSYEDTISAENRIEMENFQQKQNISKISDSNELPVKNEDSVELTPLDSDSEIPEKQHENTTKEKTPEKKTTPEKTPEKINPNNENQSERKSGQIKEVEEAISILKRLSTIKQDDDV